MEALYHQGTGIKMLTCEMFFLMKDFYTFPIRQPVSTYLILSTSIPKKPALICTDEYKLQWYGYQKTLIQRDIFFLVNDDKKYHT